MANLNYQKNILTFFQEKVLQNLFLSYEEMHSFYLTGGTALAGFYLHHRYSEDLDFFTHGEFDSFKLEQILKDFTAKNGWILGSSRKTTFFYEVFLAETTDSLPLKIDFVKDINVHFGELESWKGVPIDSLRNIASNKVGTIFSRTEPKDYVDLYFLLQKNLPFFEIFKEAQEKDGGLNEFYFAASLRNVNRIQQLPRMIRPLPLEELQKTLLGLADQFLKLAKPF